MVDWSNPETLRTAIAQTDLSVRAFADLSGVSHSQIYRILEGRFKPRYETAKRIEAALSAHRRPKKRASVAQKAAA